MAKIPLIGGIANKKRQKNGKKSLFSYLKRFLSRVPIAFFGRVVKSCNSAFLRSKISNLAVFPACAKIVKNGKKILKHFDRLHWHINQSPSLLCLPPKHSVTEKLIIVVLKQR